MKDSLLWSPDFRDYDTIGRPSFDWEGHVCSMEATWKPELIMITPPDVAVIMKWSRRTYASVGIAGLYFADNIYQSVS